MSQEYAAGAAGVLAITALQLDPLSVEYSIFTFAMLLEIHVILCVEPDCHVSPPFGAVTVTAGAARMLKGASLESLTAELEASLARTSAWDDGVFGIVQEYDPVDAEVLEVISDQLAPVLVEYSSLTFATFVATHVIGCDERTFQISPPLGEPTVIPGGREIVKTALLTSKVPGFEASLMRTRAWSVGLFGRVHA